MASNNLHSGPDYHAAAYGKARHSETEKAPPGLLLKQPGRRSGYPGNAKIRISHTSTE